METQIQQEVTGKKLALNVLKNNYRDRLDSDEPAETLMIERSLDRDWKALNLRLERSAAKLGEAEAEYVAARKLEDYVRENIPQAEVYINSMAESDEFQEIPGHLNNILEKAESVPDETKNEARRLLKETLQAYENKENYDSKYVVMRKSSFMKKFGELDLEDKLILGELLHKKGIKKLGCGDVFGYYKYPSSCGACETANVNLRGIGIKGESKFVGDREYKIPEETMVRAKAKYLDGLTTEADRIDAAEIDLRIARARLTREENEGKLIAMITIEGADPQQKVKLAQGLVANNFKSYDFARQEGELFIFGSSDNDSNIVGSSVEDYKLNRVIVLDRDGNKVAEDSDRYLWRTTARGIIGDKYYFGLNNVTSDGKNVSVNVGGKVFNLEIGEPVSPAEKTVSMMPSRIYSKLTEAVMVRAEQDYPPIEYSRHVEQIVTNRGNTGSVPLYSGEGSKIASHYFSGIKEVGDNELIVSVRRMLHMDLKGTDSRVVEYTAKVTPEGDIEVNPREKQRE
jgi:hypothetical protein